MVVCELRMAILTPQNYITDLVNFFIQKVILIRLWLVFTLYKTDYYEH